MSGIQYSFKQWCLDNQRQDLLDRWDYSLNRINPEDVNYKSNKKYWFKCPENIHDSKLSDIQYICSGRSKNIYCDKCHSFAQSIIRKFSKDYFDTIWSNDNTINPWEVRANSKKKGIFICEKNSDHIYQSSFEHFSRGIRCPFCSGQLVSQDNSAGTLNPSIISIWSNKNNLTPYDYTLHSGKQVWWKCENGLHDDYCRSLAHSYTRKYKCPICAVDNQHKNARVDLTNMQFGNLTARYVDECKTNQTGKVHWICDCSCGAIVSVPSSNLTTGNSTTCGNRLAHYSGSNNGNWKGGKTPELLCERTSSRYNKWRDEVYRKDWYTCQCCGKSRHIVKNAHHLINFAQNEDIRYDISNGITLCEDCHYSTISGSFHNIYGTTNNTPEQLEAYINNKRKELGINIPFSIQDYKNGICLKPNDVIQKEE